MVTDFTCDLNCPGHGGHKVPKGICCAGCFKSRQYHINESNKHLWSEQAGFLGENGCRLEHKYKPPECKAYDCKTRTFYLFNYEYLHIRWDGTRWKNPVSTEGHLIGTIEDVDPIVSVLSNRIKRFNKKMEDSNEITRTEHNDGQELAGNDREGAETPERQNSCA